MCTALLTAGCTSSSGPSSPDAAQVQKSLGRVPIPTAPSDQPTATASVQHPTVLEMGAPVSVALPGGVRAVLTALGPQELTSAPGTPRTVGIMTVKAQVTKGSLTMSSSDFSSRNEEGKVVTLKSGGARSVTAKAGHTSTLIVKGTYASGAAQLTWRHRGDVVAIWDFNIELD